LKGGREMTIEDFRKLNTGDYVKLAGHVYEMRMSSRDSFSFFGVVEDLSLVVHFYSDECDCDITINGSLTNYPIDYIINATEKDCLEYQLKHEEEKLDNNTKAAKLNIEFIKQKISELDSPKIGKMYRLTCKSNNHSWYGALVGITTHGTYKFVSYYDKRKVVTEGFPIEGFSKWWSFVEVPEKESIAKSILEFIKLGETK
jgi:hypothetical protein